MLAMGEPDGRAARGSLSQEADAPAVISSRLPRDLRSTAISDLTFHDATLYFDVLCVYR